MNKKREAEIESKLNGYQKLLKDRIEKTELARKSAKKIAEEIRELRATRSRVKNRRKSAI